LKPFLTWSSDVAESFPQLMVCVGIVRNVRVLGSNVETAALRERVIKEARERYKLETLKNHPAARAYRGLFWKLNIDPTKTRPAGEALLRRVLHGKEIPRISNVVDAYNLASLKTLVPMSGFDLDLVSPPLHVRFSKEDDLFKGIGMKTPAKLEKKMLVLADEKRVLCIYPYRDADATKVTEKTRNVLVVGYGAPGISKEKLAEAVETALSYIKLTASGLTEPPRVFQPQSSSTSEGFSST